jgi:probable addiction module antidote protein
MVMAEKFYPFDPADYLDSQEAIEVFMADAFETGDAPHIAAAMSVVARAQGMNDLAAKAGLTQEQLDRFLNGTDNPSLTTTLAVIKAMGLNLAVTSDQAGTL